MSLAETWEREFGRALPGKIVCVGQNYRDHAAEQGIEPPSEPLLFGKFANTVRWDGEPIVLPRGGGHVDAEAELAVVIGRGGRHIAREGALAAVYGYTCANDVSHRDFQYADGQWLRGKGFDSFCPLGPRLAPAAELDPSDLRVVQRLNGDVLQDSRTNQLIFDVPFLVAHASTVFTLEPGDVILTGTPSGVGFFRDPKRSLEPGDVVEVEVEGIGVLSNPVVAE